MKCYYYRKYSTMYGLVVIKILFHIDIDICIFLES